MINVPDHLTVHVCRQAPLPNSNSRWRMSDPLPPAAALPPRRQESNLPLVRGSLTHHPELRLHEWNFASIHVNRNSLYRTSIAAYSVCPSRFSESSIGFDPRAAVSWE